ncbi:hypothetical protein NXC14_CH02735 [Rhizobium sp. NXC14]|nr:hypothetical protein NXC14_CH02735 [Rhizobium sp. NXC14]
MDNSRAIVSAADISRFAIPRPLAAKTRSVRRMRRPSCAFPLTHLWQRTPPPQGCPVLRFILHALIVIILTLLTQIGGLTYLITLAVARALRLRRLAANLALFLLLYAGGTFVAHLNAPAFGRVPLACFVGTADPLVIRSPIYCALNRNYVTPELRDLAGALAAHMDKQFPGTVTVALDANFPFVDGFPLLPHLSHADGKKLDFAYYYKDADGAFLNGATRSPIGYFAFEEPAQGDELPCAGRHDWLPRVGISTPCSHSSRPTRSRSSAPRQRSPG